MWYLSVSALCYALFLWPYSYIVDKDTSDFLKNLGFCAGPSCRLSRQALKWHKFNVVIRPGPRHPSLTHLAQWLHPFLHGHSFPSVSTLLHVGPQSSMLCTIGSGVFLVCSNWTLSLNAWITNYSSVWASVFSSIKCDGNDWHSF